MSFAEWAPPTKTRPGLHERFTPLLFALQRLPSSRSASVTIPNEKIDVHEKEREHSTGDRTATTSLAQDEFGQGGRKGLQNRVGYPSNQSSRRLARPGDPQYRRPHLLP